MLIDWLRRLHINADAALAQKRWCLAKKIVPDVKRNDVIRYLRLFLFPSGSAEIATGLTEYLLKLDPEFPATDNTEEIRLLAGLVMVATFETRSSAGDAFALGLKSAIFPQHRCNPVNSGIIDEAAKYLQQQSATARPADFKVNGDSLAKKLQEVQGESATGQAQINLPDFAAVLDEMYGRTIVRLAEEVGILWWLLGGYSPTLSSDAGSVEPGEYALIAAHEAALRTQVLPPPPSVYAILSKALSNCKRVKNRDYALRDIVLGADKKWRGDFVKAHTCGDCADLVPVTTLLVKTDETDDIDIASKTLAKTCPGVTTKLEITPSDAARQFYNEIVFLHALAILA